MRTIITAPGLGSVSLKNPICPLGNFTWAEATENGERLPTAQAVKNICRLAGVLQHARDQIGKPFIVTSWYRPEPFNTQAGGVPNSQHLDGSAIDFYVEGMTSRQLYDRLAWWMGGMGRYPDKPALLHLDIGPLRRWGN